MYKYNDFLIEKQFRKWESLSLNESFDSMMDSIHKFLDKEFTFDTSRFEEKVVKLFTRFKGKVKIVTTIVSLLLSSYLSSDKISELMSKSGYTKAEQQEIIANLKVDHTKNNTHKVKSKVNNENKKFLNALAQRESTDDWRSVNQFGYIGKYQFGKQALEDLGLDDKIDSHKFKLNPAIFPIHAQDKAMVALLKKNKEYLGDYIENFEGKMIAGVKVTKSGLLAGSHLVGASAIKQFLDSNGRVIPKDGNDVPVTEYIKKFGGYNLTF